MKNFKFVFLIYISVVFFACKKDKETKSPVLPAITSSEYKNDLLFINRADFQILTSEPAEFSSDDTLIDISIDGLIKRITSAEVVPINITWKNSGNKLTIYAVGATDDSFDAPYARFHGALATDSYSALQAGWETLRKLPFSQETYVIVLRHADADLGRDYSISPTDQGPPEWWKSCDPDLARQLNQTGIIRSTELGNIFRDLDYSFARVISSEFCRSVKTAELINAGPTIQIDGRLNHPSYNKSGLGAFVGMKELVQEFPVDNKMSLIVTHHPVNEIRTAIAPGFPQVSPFSWTGGYIIKVDPDKSISYQGAVSFGMFKYWRNLKLKR
ncbi:histidine phosphatase family protein [Daejeonella oryzae]|uniref:histidine phosphatase family protein n=1 Tax=Daejeonella oryzae TaxID=1122943 RepID=UPI00042A3352|nr:histidine phosphatase family protein [Daejeonella oryzae]